MGIVLLVVVFILIPVALFQFKQYRLNTPSLQWPVLAKVLNLTYEADPPRLTGTRNGRKVLVETCPGGARVASVLERPSRLRIEVGPKADMLRKAGMIVPDPVLTGDQEFEEKLMARCSDKAVGARMFDPHLRQVLLGQPCVEILGQGSTVQWTFPVVKDPDVTETALDIVTVFAEEMDRLPEA